MIRSKSVAILYALSLLLGCKKMDNSERHFSALPAEQILQELENLMVQIAEESDKPWVKATTLRKLVYDKYQISLEAVIQQKGYDSLKSFLISSQRFSIYNQPCTQEFYVALFSDVNRHLTASNFEAQHRLQYTIKRPWKVDGSLLEMLKSEGYKEITKKQNVFFQKPAKSTYKPQLIEIKSRKNLEFVLIEIIQDLTINCSQEFVTIGQLSTKFYEYYRQPIRGIFRSLSIKLKLIDVLQSISYLSLKKVDDNWQIRIDANVI